MTQALSYAIPQHQQTKPATVGFLLGVLGLGLIFLSGCFMIGILVVQFEPSTANQAAKTSPVGLLVYTAVLYAFAFGCFGGGTLVLVKAVKKLVAA